MTIPKDPFILLSYINTKLRDEFHNLEELCEGLEINRSELESTLSSIGYNYIRELNCFSDSI